MLHRLAREEGLLVGGSAGTAVAAALRVARTLGPDDVVVVIVPDSGRAYLSKYFDNEWLGRLGFPLYHAATGPVVRDARGGRGSAPRAMLPPQPSRRRVSCSRTPRCYPSRWRARSPVRSWSRRSWDPSVPRH
ncbi:cystathionine beta-synthase [Rhodococcus opacus RKJ300 = JCM 13270]|uniref:Cystathionine beta-synthase n=1 Tax=Rhodococcus opacus RKJ300 = JCM 13270 TaxID=1165867 RepID=I0WLQ0_RHOOP|nr:cystathionine beta-synthase [Rhodococcus opacus RKJ300 = JCM 13270]